MRRFTIPVATAWAAGLCSVGVPARAVVVWTGDLETGDVSQWQGTLNPQNITVVPSPVAQGMWAAHIQLTNDAVWPNGLKRVELRHLPASARTAEGADTYFAWSFYLPATLPTDPSQQIGYWESQQSYQQMMAFAVEGERIRFVTRQPMNQTQWQDDTAATAQIWHRIAMHIVWSKDPLIGTVDVWFDGNQVVTAGAAKTLNDDNPHFTQVGLLRGMITFSDMPVIVIDDAVEGDTLADVRPDALSPGPGGAGGSSSSNGGAGPASGAGGATGGGPSAGGATALPASGEDGSGCGCDVVRGEPRRDMRWGLVALVACAAATMRRGARRRAG